MKPTGPGGDDAMMVTEVECDVLKTEDVFSVELGTAIEDSGCTYPVMGEKT